MSGEEMRERLAEALEARGNELGVPSAEAARKAADALLPVVRAIVAEELDGVLDDVQRRVRDAPDATAALAGIALDVLNRKEAADR